MKVGDMVQYVHHASWENAGLGVITDAKEALLRSGASTLAFQIAWFDDIEDHGWNKAIKELKGEVTRLGGELKDTKIQLAEANNKLWTQTWIKSSKI